MLYYFLIVFYLNFKNKLIYLFNIIVKSNLFIKNTNFLKDILKLLELNLKQNK